MVRKKTGKKGMMAWIVLCMVAIAILTFYIWHQTQSFQLGIELSSLEAEIDSLQKDIERLEIEKSSLESLDIVEKIARERLHLRPALAEQVFDERNAAKTTETGR